MSPYANIPDKRFWRRAIVETLHTKMWDIHTPKWTLRADDTIVTMGSCFAQHIGRSLRQNGFNVPFYDDERYAKDNAFSANYGNVYTTRQALQLMQEAMGKRTPSDIVWKVQGGYIDALRPNAVRSPFETPDELLAARKVHLENVLKALRDMDIFVFTMGLTEAWKIKECDTILPVAPGTMGGTFSPDLHEFHNLSYGEVLQDLTDIMDLLKEIRGGQDFRLLLTVSPVPLAATAEDAHILLSTTYSKSVLRAVAGDFVKTAPNYDYFPSYEIITNPRARSNQFGKNLRAITDDGVKNVMRHFSHAYMGKRAPKPNSQFEEVGDVDCEEALLEQFAKAPQRIATEDSRLIFFGNSHLGYFRTALTDEEVVNQSSFAALNLMTNDPFKTIKRERFRTFEYRDSLFKSATIPSAEYLCIVGFGIFGDNIVRAFGPVLAGADGVDGTTVSPTLPIVDAVGEDVRKKFRSGIQSRFKMVQRILKHGGFRKIWWVVSPDFPENVARYRLGDAFVDSGAYKLYKAAYQEEFDKLNTLGDQVEFIYHDRQDLYAENGFVRGEFANLTQWDIHPHYKFYRDVADQVTSSIRAEFEKPSQIPQISLVSRLRRKLIG